MLLTDNSKESQKIILVNCFALYSQKTLPSFEYFADTRMRRVDFRLFISLFRTSVVSTNEGKIYQEYFLRIHILDSVSQSSPEVTQQRIGKKSWAGKWFSLFKCGTLF
jgi:hypothetical protein